MISLESLIADRVLQAADGTSVTFDEAVRLCLVVLEQANWNLVDSDILERDRLQPSLGLGRTYRSVVEKARRLRLEIEGGSQSPV